MLTAHRPTERDGTDIFPTVKHTVYPPAKQRLHQAFPAESVAGEAWLPGHSWMSGEISDHCPPLTGTLLFFGLLNIYKNIEQRVPGHAVPAPPKPWPRAFKPPRRAGKLSGSFPALGVVGPREIITFP
jgi:hypothetical protein